MYAYQVVTTSSILILEILILDYRPIVSLPDLNLRFSAASVVAPWL